MKKKILVTEEQLKYIINFIGNSDDKIEEQLIKPKIKGGGFIRKSKERVGTESFTSEITVKEVTDSLSWLKTNMSEDVRNEFEKKLYAGKKYWNSWIVPTMSALTNPVEFTEENVASKYNSIYYVKMCIESYLEAKSKSEKKIKKIAIQPLGEKTIESPKEEGGDPVIINFTKKLVNQKDIKPFEDNMSQPTEFLINNVNEIVSALKVTLDEALNKDPELKKMYDEKPNSFTWECTDLAVASSASRYANTENAKDKNFITLSKERAENGYNKIKEIFKNSGISFGKTFEQNSSTPDTIKFDGENGDGSSGPPPPKPYRMADLKNEGNVGGNPNYIDSKNPNYEKVYNDNVNKYGKPLTNKNNYDQYKYFWFSCNFELKVNKPPTPPTPPEPKKIKSYKIVFYRTQWKWNLKFNTNIGLTIPRISFGLGKKTGVVSCPRFSGKPKVGGKVINFN